MTILGTAPSPVTVSRASRPGLEESTRQLTTDVMTLDCQKPRTPAPVKWAIARTAARGVARGAVYGALGYYAGSQAGLLPTVATLYLASRMFAPGFMVGVTGTVLAAARLDE